MGNLKRMMQGLVLSVAMATTSGVALAQTPVEEAVGPIEGTWQGSGWRIGADRERATFDVFEEVRLTSGNHAAVIRGLGFEPMGAGMDGELGHDASALLFATPDGLKLRSVTMEGQTILADVTPMDGGFDWGFTLPQGTIRYEIRVVDGLWIESGYFCRSEEQCFQTLEMTLERVE